MLEAERMGLSLSWTVHMVSKPEKTMSRLGEESCSALSVKVVLKAQSASPTHCEVGSCQRPHSISKSIPDET